ncbi:hypothetical protein M0805_009703 [Coniferiporia weirii]|nr:hypothetical protein M0805_009703 [Coniferiporia weirii]
MPLKVIKSSIKPKDIVLAATSIAAVIADVADMASFPPARAVATVILVILKTVQEMDNNKTSCYKLARRAAKILLDLRRQMEGRWDSGPKALLDNITSFEKTLTSIRDFMFGLAKVKWMGRLLQKGAIESSLESFHDLLDEAEKSFQIASLIEIHYTVGVLQQRSAGIAVDFVETVAENDLAKDESISIPSDDVKSIPEVPLDQAECIHESLALVRPLENLTVSEQTATMENLTVEDEAEFERRLEEELAELDKFGFKRYHQTEVLLRSALRNTGPNSFWTSTSLGEVNGQRAIVKRYDSNEEKDKKAATKRWLHDIKILKDLYHANLPQLVGYSDEKCPTPFILLSQVKLRDPTIFMLNALQEMSIAQCANAVLRMYRDVTSVALYVQRQLSLDERETQVFVAEASYSVDADSGNMIIGIPPPRDPNSYHGFGYRLTESLVDKILQNLPKSDKLLTLASTGDSSAVVNLQNKLAHVRALVLNMLPKAGHPPDLAEFAEELLEADCEGGERGRPRHSLSRIRIRNIEAGTHDFAWHEGIHSCPLNFTVGDVGFISRDYDHIQMSDKSRFDGFVKIGNVFDGGAIIEKASKTVQNVQGMDIVREVIGTQGQWNNGFHRSYEIFPFVLPDNVESWPIALLPQAEIDAHIRHTARMSSVNEAWRYLMREAADLARVCNVEPHKIILITKTILGQIYKAHDFRPRPHISPSGNTHNHAFGSRFGNPGMGHSPAFGQGPGGFGGHSLRNQQAPQMIYLFTSHKEEFRPFWADNPSEVSMPSYKRRGLGHLSITTSVGWFRPESFIDYIQLSEEDFMDECA